MPSTQLTRRTMLAIAGSTIMVGASAGTAGAVPGVGDDYDCDETTEIVTAKSGDEVVATEDVPKAWYDHVQYVRDVREQFGNEYSVRDTEWIRTIGITSIDEPICDMRQSAISVGVEDVDEAVEILGDAYEGVPLEIQERGELSTGAGRIETDIDENASTEEIDSDQDDDPEVTTMDDSLPGFGFLAGIAGLAGVAAHLHGKRREK